MAALKVYATNLWKVQRAVCAKLGLQVASAPLSERALAVSGDILLGTLCKLLVDKGLVTDAELNAAFNATAAASIPQLAVTVPMPTQDGESAPDPEMGA